MIEADAGQMQQIVMNLILNAAEAIGDRRGSVTVTTDTLLLTADDADLWEYTGEPLSPRRYVMLRVQDDGSGMDEETLSKIFDPFFTTKFTGRGLGLAAVLGIVRGHKGGLRVRSQLGVGTTFELCFPASAEQSGKLAAPDRTAVAFSGCVLVIDDEESVREAVKDILEVEGLRVEIAANGLEGVQRYREKSGQIDLVLLDLSMPGLSGAETLDELQVIDPHVNVLLSSGFSREEATRRFKGKRLAGFVQKPYSAKTLLDIVRRHIRAL
jgi:CheY-like chemotaxis protein